MYDLPSKQERRCIHHGITLLLTFSIILMFSGCTSMSSPVGQGMILSNVRGPVAATGSSVATKVGYSSCVNVLGLVAVGDSSINAAMKRAQITKIHHVDNRILSVLFFFTKHTTIVYGE